MAKTWLIAGISSGPRVGDAFLTVSGDRAAIEARVKKDPFVLNSVASAQILGVIPSTVDERVSFLRGS